MKEPVTTGSGMVERTRGGATLRVEAWSRNCIRVRFTLENEFKAYDWAIRPKDTSLKARVSIDGRNAIVSNGAVSVEIVEPEPSPVEPDPETSLRFFSTRTGKTLLQEKRSRITLPDPGHSLKAAGPSSFRAEARFTAFDDESFYGLGQNQDGRLDQKGCCLELLQMNSHTVVPVLYSSRGYGFFWNNPAYGRVELARNGTAWLAEHTDQLDYFVFAGETPAETMQSYAELTGYPSMMPEWALGFWQCKLRYRTQGELLEVAREHKRRGLPLSVIVIDFFHWSKMGEWDFDPACWPDPSAMTRELREMGVQLMVSIWPMVNVRSSRYREMSERGYLVRAERGLPVFMQFTDTNDSETFLHLVDFTNPDAGRYVWDVAKKNYFDRGVGLFWLDTCEPEMKPYDVANLRYRIGNGAKYSALYPMLEEKAFYEGLKSAGVDLPINLCRSAWAGSQKYGVCAWSGDVFSTFEVMQGQIKNGLNMAMAGIPWWTTDIGGFFGGRTGDPEFRELVVRWFQWSVFCPVLRLHGFRDSWDVKAGGDNEVWSFGEQAYEIIKHQLFIREQLRPYILEQMRTAHERGIPVMRPLFFDFPEDAACYSIEDEYLFGPEVLVAPVVRYGDRSRTVYLPRGAQWKASWDQSIHPGGTTITVECPLERIPVFLRDAASTPVT